MVRAQIQSISLGHCRGMVASRTMGVRMVKRAIVVLLLVSFACIAAHACLLGEDLSDRGDCPFCQWLHALGEGEPPIATDGVAVVLERVLPALSSVVPPLECGGPFPARAPPTL